LNSLEKNSFYSFLALYIISSTFFIIVSAYWYYTAQYNSLEQNEYYRLQHLSDKISQSVITAHMSGSKLEMPEYDEDIDVALVDINGKVVFGKLMDDYIPKKSEYFTSHGHNILSSDSTQEHLKIKFVVLHSDELFSKIAYLKQSVISTVSISIVSIIILAILLGRIFMKPLRTRIKQIEDFVHDTAHELNTPITALSMSVSRALKKDTCDSKLLKNISVSTKQLFDIYNALSYLSFEAKDEEVSEINVCRVVEKSVAYYGELAQSKGIVIISTCSVPHGYREFTYSMDETKLTMLFGNLINNAIKYSHPNSKIIISFIDGVFRIEDKGIGIADNELKYIYDRFNRATDYAGGFGIGLSIVKKITQEYSLGLHVESKLGEGTVFEVDFK